MKTILILTDFSPNADHAARSAAKIAGELGADILIYNTYYDHLLLPGYPGGPWVAEEFVFLRDESNTKLSNLAEELKAITGMKTAQDFKPQISYECGEGLLSKNLKAILQENKVELIVIGNSTDSTMDHLVFGSDTLEVIDHSSCPVLIIPPKAEMNHLEKVTLATAVELADIYAINYLVGLGEKLGFALEIVHVSDADEMENPEDEQTVQQCIKELKGKMITYKQIRGKDVVKRLNRFCKTDESDMLALVHNPRGFIFDRFITSKTEEALTKQHIPLLIFPSEMR